MTLEVSNLRIAFGDRTVVDDISFEVPTGDRLGIIGESGSGKSLTTLAILGLLPETASISGSIKWLGRELIGLSDKKLAKIRGKEIGVVFQDPSSALDPIKTVGAQVAAALRNHYQLSRDELVSRVQKSLVQVGLPDPAELANRYPHQLSGGQRQRVAIAAAIITSPRLLIADEPTTALDVTVQAAILELFNELTTKLGASLIFVTHDIALLSQVVSHAAVMANGRIIESGALRQLLTTPAEAVTKSLVAAAAKTSWDGVEHG